MGRLALRGRALLEGFLVAESSLIWNRSAYSSECDGMCYKSFVRGFLLTSGSAFGTLSTDLVCMTFFFWIGFVPSGTSTDECAEAGFVEPVRLYILIEVGSLI